MGLARSDSAASADLQMLVTAATNEGWLDELTLDGWEAEPAVQVMAPLTMLRRVAGLVLTRSCASPLVGQESLLQTTATGDLAAQSLESLDIPLDVASPVEGAGNKRKRR